MKENEVPTQTIICDSEDGFKEIISRIKNEQLAEGVDRVQFFTSDHTIAKAGIAFSYFKKRDDKGHYDNFAYTEILVPVHIFIKFEKFLPICNKFNEDLDAYIKGL